MDAFIYSPLLDRAARGTVYDGLMHVSDWFPTLIGLTGTTRSRARDGARDGTGARVDAEDIFWSRVRGIVC